MKRSHVLYIIAAVIATSLVILVCTSYGKIRALDKFLALLEKNESLLEDGLRQTLEPKEASQRPSLKCDYDISDFHNMINSITRVLEFFQLYLKDLILDASVGARILQGQLQLILQSFSLPVEIKTQLEQLLRNVTDIGDQIVGHFVEVMMESDQSPDGEKRLKENLQWIKDGSLWEMPAAGHWQERDDLDLERYIVEDDSTIVFSDIDFSDRCIGAVFDNCSVPDDCFKLFLAKRHSEYLITHAIMFLLFAKKKNCFNDHKYMEEISKIGKPDDIMASFCAKIFVEAQTIDITGFNIHYQDLFCEEVLVCSMSGFRQFLQLSWLRAILSWQSKDGVGCFELPQQSQSKTFEEIYGIEKESKRVKRYDNLIPAGAQSCSAHFSGVAIGAIGVHLRYLVETCGGSIFGTVSGST